METIRNKNITEKKWDKNREITNVFFMIFMLQNKSKKRSISESNYQDFHEIKNTFTSKRHQNSI